MQTKPSIHPKMDKVRSAGVGEGRASPGWPLSLSPAHTFPVMPWTSFVEPVWYPETMLKTAYLGLGKSRYSFAGDGKLVKVGNSNKEEVSQSRPRGKGMDTDSGKKKKKHRVVFRF